MFAARRTPIRERHTATGTRSLRSRVDEDNRRLAATQYPPTASATSNAIPEKDNSGPEAMEKLRQENIILGRAIEELLKKQRPSSQISVENLLNENKVLSDRLQCWKKRALEEASFVEELKGMISVMPDSQLMTTFDKSKITNPSTSGSNIADAVGKLDNLNCGLGLTSDNISRAALSPRSARAERFTIAELEALLMEERRRCIAVETARTRDFVEIARLEDELRKIKSNPEAYKFNSNAEQMANQVLSKMDVCSAGSPDDRHLHTGGNQQAPMYNGNSQLHKYNSGGSQPSGFYPGSGSLPPYSAGAQPNSYSGGKQPNFHLASGNPSNLQLQEGMHGAAVSSSIPPDGISTSNFAVTSQQSSNFLGSSYPGSSQHASNFPCSSCPASSSPGSSSYPGGSPDGIPLHHNPTRMRRPNLANSLVSAEERRLRLVQGTN